jgi:hypothetical protein
MKPVDNKYLIRVLRGCARELAKPYESRDEDFEDDEAAWIMREAAKRLNKQEATINRLMDKLKNRDR